MQNDESLAQPLRANANTEHEFWNTAPKYSDPPPRLSISMRPAVPRPSRLRVVLARLLFFVLFSGTLALLVYEAAHKYGITTADVRAFVAGSGRR